MPGDTVLKKADAFQGKRKVKDWWSEVEYEVICQVANGVPSYEIKDSSGNVKLPTVIDYSYWPPLEVKSHPCAKVRMLTPACQPGLH